MLTLRSVELIMLPCLTVAILCWSAKTQTLWESFRHPTDTILPGQVINQNGKLVSRHLETNYSRGRFQFKLHDNGSLVLYKTNFPLDTPTLPYWKAQDFSNDSALVFNMSGNIFLRASNRSVISENAPSTQDSYHRAILEYDGVFRHYVYPKIPVSSTRRWSLASPNSFIPSDICLDIREEIGSGACGFNSYCMFDERKSCHCPTGYSPIDPNDDMKGCKQDFFPHSCDETHPDSNNFDFSELQQINWPSSDIGKFEHVTEEWCRQECLGDCYCAVAYFRIDVGRCWMKKLPFSNGRYEQGVESKALIKKRKDNSTLNYEDSNRNKDQSVIIMIGSVFLGISVILLVASVLCAYWFRHRKSKVCQTSQLMAGMNLRNFSYKELSKATDGFKEKLGHGAFATVYKGVLLDDSENVIAVKRLNNMVKENEKEFKAEVTAIGQTHHRNLVKLLGFCDEGEHNLLVYEYMSKGSLANFIFESERPSWYQRVQIALGTAKGLLYLHEECNSQIIHCDVKPQNILLDDSYTAKISDFGLAKLLKTDQMLTNTAIRGTKGYVAPEWFRSMPVSFKVDVYSFGVLLLELICCRRSFDITAESEKQMVLVDWAFDCFKDRKLNILLKDDMEVLDDMNRVERYLMIAFWCIQENPALRPTMMQVLQLLEGVVDVEYPSDPYSFNSSF